MLINVFGHWINPDKITYLDSHDNESGTRYTFINFGHAGEGMDSFLDIPNHSVDEVAQEINRQTRMGKCSVPDIHPCEYNRPAPTAPKSKINHWVFKA